MIGQISESEGKWAKRLVTKGLDPQGMIIGGGVALWTGSGQFSADPDAGRIFTSNGDIAQGALRVSMLNNSTRYSDTTTTVDDFIIKFFKLDFVLGFFTGKKAEQIANRTLGGRFGQFPIM